MQYFLTLAFGTFIGLALGLTGGGGSILAVPVLVYGLEVDPREAVGVSLAAVGATSIVGFVQRWRGGEVELGTGVVFAVLGMLGAPLGTWLNARIPEAWLMISFAGLMVAVAVRMWLGAAGAQTIARAQSIAEVSPPVNCAVPIEIGGPACRRDPAGVLRLTSRCAALLAVLGFVTGVLAGLFGVGGGLVIVPALVLYSQMEIRRAIGTSLLVIALVSASGVATYLLSGRALPLGVTGGFIGGGVLGLCLATGVSRRLSGPRLQKIFASLIIAVAAFVVTKSAWFNGSAG